VKAVTVVLASGEVLRLRRGEAAAADGRLVLSSESRGKTEIRIPLLDMPATKHAAGYCLRQDMDAIDLFVGSEGTLGIIVDVELRLELEPRERLFMTAFLPSEAKALGFVQDVRHGDSLDVLAVEYYGPNALRLLREKRAEEGASSGVPPLPESVVCAVYVEVAFDGDMEFADCYRHLEALLKRLAASPRGTWAGFGAVDMRAMRAFRHALPEQVNGIIGRRKNELPSLHKVGTDMAVPDERLEDVVALYRTELEASGLEHVIFGHVGNNHLHVNILPRSEEELARAKALYELFAREVVAMGGSVSAEHGIGRIKKPFLLLQYGPGKVKEMKAIKDALDPDGLLNPGVLF
jgi:D-lactate dehydrogenase (cytochrome)